MTVSKFLRLFCISIIGMSMISSCVSSEKKATNNISIVPMPNQMNITQGVFSSKNIKLNITTDMVDEFSLQYYMEQLGAYVNFEPQSTTLLTINQDSTIATQGYVLNITPNEISINASNRQGVLYALNSLNQLFSQYAVNEIAVPCLSINDAPQYSWRGMHLDVCRHFYDVAFIKKMLDAMALNKLNVFHWHLTDDQGWRIEIKKYPLLTEKGAWREETIMNHMANHPKQFDGKPYGGFYTQEQIKEVVAYADKLGITVLPEIEMPGHAVAAARAFPDLTCTGKPKPFNEWGVSDDVFCAGNEATFEFLQNVIDEVIELFPSEYIHVGGDECPKTKWEQCPKCQARMKKEDLKNEMELQSYFIKRMEKYISSKGRKLIGWDEILEGGLPEGASVMSWRGIEGGVEAASHGHDVVICPNAEVYLDHYQSNYNEPLAIAGYTTMEEIYHWSPMPDSLDAAYRHHILGSQGNLWTEYMPTSEQVEYMAYPRLCALAEMLWTQDSVQNYESFTKRMNQHYKRLDAIGIHYRIPYPEEILPVEALTPEANLIALSVPMEEAKIYYTTDGSNPMEKGIIYKEPLAFNEASEMPVTLQCVTKMPNGRWSAIHKSEIFVSNPLEAATEQVSEGALYCTKKGKFNTAVIDFSDCTTPTIQKGIHISEDAPSNFYAEQISGYFKVPVSGIYTFTLTSDDGSILSIHDRNIIDNDGFSYGRTRQGRIALKEGLHPFVIQHFQAKYGADLSLTAIAPDGRTIDFTSDHVFH